MYTGTIINDGEEIQPSTGACGENCLLSVLGPEKHSLNSKFL